MDYKSLSGRKSQFLLASFIWMREKQIESIV